MPINYAEKHAAMIDERFTAGSVTEPMINKDFDFVGVQTVKVHSVPTVAMNNYARTGSNRYGTPSELADAVQELTLSQDRSFTYTVDKGNSEDDPALNAGKALARQIDEVIVPEVDSYRLVVMAANGTSLAYGAITKDNAYAAFLAVNTMLDNAKVPRAGRICRVTGTYNSLIKQDPAYVKASDSGQQMVIVGQVGMVDGVPIGLDYGRLPTGVAFMIVHPSATTAPNKLSEYKTHIDPPGINGVLVEGRDYFDAFVLNNKVAAIGLQRTAKLALAVTNAAGASGKTKFTAVTGYTGELSTPLGALCYKIDASTIAAVALGADISDDETYIPLTIGAEITATTGHHYRIYLKDQNGNLIGESADGTVTSGE